MTAAAHPLAGPDPCGGLPARRPAVAAGPWFRSGPCLVLLVPCEAAASGFAVPAYVIHELDDRPGRKRVTGRTADPVPLAMFSAWADTPHGTALLCRDSMAGRNAAGEGGAKVKLPDGRWVNVDRTAVIYPGE